MMPATTAVLLETVYSSTTVGRITRYVLMTVMSSTPSELRFFTYSYTLRGKEGWREACREAGKEGGGRKEEWKRNKDGKRRKEGEGRRKGEICANYARFSLSYDLLYNTYQVSAI